ncbi:MAG: polynucleotide adenylyltransferase PcnB, partial [Gammaproteobacteria bacterium]|nr:polynucleotide adenylyltransferase PcnB [Gammaproteobacteria bacterium]
RIPKDFDISTDARPEDVRKLFRNCRLIGRRFRLAHVHFGDEIIEVATFRGDASAEDDEDLDREIVNGMIVRDNVYGTLQEDARRRDFTINSLYYNINDFSVVDYVGGLRDLKSNQLRLIGDAEQRYREDPVRMLRAVRFAGKLGFKLEQSTEAPLKQLGHLLESVPPARLFEEVLKLFLSGSSAETFRLLREYNLFKWLFLQTEEALLAETDGVFLKLIQEALKNTDERVSQGKPVTPAFTISVFLWRPVAELKQRYLQRGMTEHQALLEASEVVIAGQSQHVAVPRRFQTSLREIWQLQDRFEKRAPKRSLRLLSHPRFRAAYDFLLLRATVGDVNNTLAEWWTELYNSEEKHRGVLVEKLTRRKRRRKTKRN